MTVYIQLTIAGNDSGPFNLFSDVTGYSSAFEINVSKNDLLAGYASSLVPDGTQSIRIASLGTCTNYIDIKVEPLPTTTTSTTAPL